MALSKSATYLWLHQLPERRFKFLIFERELDNFLWKEALFTGIKFIGGGALAIYTYDRSTDRILPLVYSLVAVEGAWQYFKLLYKVLRNRISWFYFDDGGSPYNVAAGTMIYFGSLYVFSEAWPCNKKLCIYFLGTAAAGLYLAAGSIHKSKRASKVNVLLKCCQFVSVPALIASGATYLWYFQNLNEGWMEWLPLVLICKSGLLLSANGYNGAESLWTPILLLVKAIELLIGGCIVAVSSTVLALYFSTKEFHSFWSILMSFMAFSGFLFVLGSISCFQRYVDMDLDVSMHFGSIISGTFLIFWSCLLTKCIGYNIPMFLQFMILAGIGHIWIWHSVHYLSLILPPPIFTKYCQRTLGPLLTICSSVAAAYVAYRMGWRYSLISMPLPCAGIYVTYKGFSSPNQSHLPAIAKYSQRTLGPLLAIGSTVASAYVGYHMGWQYSLMVMPLTCAGIYATYRGFRRA